MADVAMPRLSDSMEEGTILKWLKSDGDEVSKGEELVEIETDKANMTYEADQDGTLKIVAQEGDTLAVGETIASIGGGSNGASAETAPKEEEGSERGASEEREGARSPSRRATRPSGQEAARASDGGTGGPPARGSGAARRRRRSRGAWRASSGSSSPSSRAPGPAAGSSRPTSRPPPRATARRSRRRPRRRLPRPSPSARRRRRRRAVVSGEAQTGKGETTTQDLTRLQQTVARRMAESKATAPDFVLNVDVDMEEAVDLRKRLKAAAAEGQPVPSFNDFVVKACRARAASTSRAPTAPTATASSSSTRA